MDFVPSIVSSNTISLEKDKLLVRYTIQKYYFRILICCLLILFWWCNSNTYDDGDSILHFLISKYSWKHPHLFMDHWGKPFFTFISSPFAQFGFKGITFFQLLLTGLNCWLLYKIAIIRNFIYPEVIILLYLFATHTLLIINSGLTEPLFSAIVLLCYYLVLRDRYNISFILLSFLPFVRTEGIIILIIYAVYAIWLKKYKQLPLLCVGMFVYSVIGLFFHYNNFFWFWQQNPYADVSGDHYGSGNLNHYFVQFWYLTGIPFSILFMLGILYHIFKMIRQSGYFHDSDNCREFLLHFGVFTGFFFAHVVFWTFGIFGSFGMQRIMMSVMPLAAPVAGMGIYTMVSWIPSYKAKRLLLSLLIITIIVFPFSGNKAGWKLPDDFQLSEKQQLAKEVCQKHPLENKKMASLYYYFPLLYNIDPFDTNQFAALYPGAMKDPSIDIYVWDNWFAPRESYITKEQMDALSSYQKTVQYPSKNSIFILYEKQEGVK